jgi:hypothetical protein
VTHNRKPDVLPVEGLFPCPACKAPVFSIRMVWESQNEPAGYTLASVTFDEKVCCSHLAITGEQQ